jgi:uncharacterized protein
MATQTNVELVQQVYAAIGHGDIPRVLDAMAEGVEIRVPGPPEIPFAGTFQGHAGVATFFEALVASVEIHEFEPRQFVADDDTVVVLGRERLTAKATGHTWETDWAMAWTVRNGKVSLLREYHQTDAIAGAFQGQGSLVGGH